MIEEIDDALSAGNDLLNLGDTSNPKKSSISYEPPKTKEPLVAHLFSFVLHPLFMVLYAVILIFLYTDFKFLYGNQFIRFIAPVLFLSCIIPASGMYLLKATGIIRNYRLREKGERLLPFTIFFFSYGLLFYYFFSAKLSIWFLAILAIPIILLLIYALISMYWKISAHMMGIGGLTGCILSICYNVKGLNLYVLFIILFILAGCLGVSRLALNRNIPAQVYAGYLIGITVSYLTIWIGAYWGLMIFLKNL